MYKDYFNGGAGLCLVVIPHHMSSAVESISFEGMVQKTFENQKSVLYTSAKRAVAMNFKYSVGPFEKAMDAGALLSINGAVQPALECAANGDPN